MPFDTGNAGHVAEHNRLETVTGLDVYLNEIATTTWDVLGATNTWNDFGLTMWPAFTVLVPASGRLRVRTMLYAANSNTTTSTFWLAARVNSEVLISTMGAHSRVIGGTPPAQCAIGERIVSGLTPGSNATITPQFSYSSGTTGTIVIGNGRIFIEPLAA